MEHCLYSYLYFQTFTNESNFNINYPEGFEIPLKDR